MPSKQNSTLLKELKPHLASIKIAGSISKSPGKNFILCRWSYPEYSPDRMSFEAFIAEAMKADLMAAGLYSDEQGVPVQDYLKDIDLDMLTHGQWKFEVTFSAPDKPLATIRHEFDYKTKGDAVAACDLAKRAMMPAAQAYL